MYERSAIVLERYFEELFGFNKPNNLKDNYENYKTIIEEVREYQKTVKEEEKEMIKFDEAASKIQEIQKKQAKLHQSNEELEKQRDLIFNDLGENPNTLDSKLKEIEKILDNNNEELKKLREKYVKALVIFTERQKERNKYARGRRTAEESHIQNVKNANKTFETIKVEDVQEMNAFKKLDKDTQKKEIINIMIKNGKNEKVGFYEKAIEQAVEMRMEIAQEEAELYVSIYEKTKKLLNELKNDTIKLGKFEKLLRDVTVKLAFLQAEKEYIVGFLDNERMAAISGKKAHQKIMEEACENFRLDEKQIHNLYELLIRETTGKSTKKAYAEFYNKTYLKEIQEKEINFKQEVNNIKLHMGTVINLNYWRIDGIKNIYMVFQEEVSEKFNKDLSEYKIEEIEEIEERKLSIIPKEDEYENEEEDYDEEEYEDDEEDYDEEEYEDDEEDYDEEEYEDDEEYDDEDDEEDEYDDEEYDDELVEDKIDKIIKNSRKMATKKHETKTNKGLFDKLFKK